MMLIRLAISTGLLAACLCAMSNEASAQIDNTIYPTPLRPAGEGCPQEHLWGIFPSGATNIKYATHGGLSSEEREAVKAGMNAWEHPEIPFTVTYFPQPFDLGDDVLDIVFADDLHPVISGLPSSTLAITQGIVLNNGCTINFTNMYVKDYLAWFTDRRHWRQEDDELNLASVITHEGGHALGFGHTTRIGSVMRPLEPVAVPGNKRTNDSGTIGEPDMTALVERHDMFGGSPAIPNFNVSLYGFTSEMLDPLQHGRVWVEPLSWFISGSLNPSWFGCPGDELEGEDRPLSLMVGFHAATGTTVDYDIQWYMGETKAACGQDPDLMIGSTTLTLTADFDATGEVYPDAWTIPEDAEYMREYYVCARTEVNPFETMFVDNLVTSVRTFWTCPAP